MKKNMDTGYAPVPLLPLHKRVIKDNAHFTNFHALVAWYFSASGNTSDTISAKTGIPVRTVISFRSKNAGLVKHDLNLLVALAVGLHMTAEHAELLLKLNGQILRDEEPIERYYKYLLSIGSFYCIAACNDFLVENGMPPLTDNKNISCFE